jgi:phosphoglycerol transferase MdoB-like AlkP superfamily enzyme
MTIVYRGSCFDWASAHRDGSILFVVVESWGDPVNPAVRDWIESPLRGAPASARWAISRRSVPFKGATTAGEIRLLCASAVHYSRMGTVGSEHCIGKSLKELGFNTTALHGFSRLMFDRSDWWGKLGFDRMIFEDNLPSSAPRCGTFLRGVCDAYMVDAAVKQLGSSRFVYLLTLDTHLPLKSLPLETSEKEFCEQQKLSANVCQLAVQTRRLIGTIVNFSTALEPAPLLVLAGDHSPPFFNELDRAMYATTQVPLIVATPR